MRKVASRYNTNIAGRAIRYGTNVARKSIIWLCILLIMGVSFFSIDILNVNAIVLLSDNDKQQLEKVMKETEGLYGDSLYKMKAREDDTKSEPMFEIKAKALTGTTVKLYNVSLNTELFKKYSDEYKDIILYRFQTNIEKSTMSSEGKQYIYSEVRNYYDYDYLTIKKELIDNILPDMLASYDLVYDTLDVVALIVGIIAYTLIVVQVFSITADIAYMQTPVFREYSLKFSHAVSKRLRFSQERVVLDKPWFVSFEAAYANKVVHENNMEINPLFLYLKMKALSFIIVAFVLVMLTSGNLTDMIIDFWNLYQDVTRGIWG